MINDYETKSKKKKKSKTDRYSETYSNYSHIEIKKKKRKKTELINEIHCNCDETEIKRRGKKKKKDKNEMFDTIFDEPEVNFGSKRKHRKKHSNFEPDEEVESYSDCKIINENKTACITDSTNKPLEKYVNPPEMSTEVANTFFSSNEDCCEDPVDFEVPPLHQFETVYRLTEIQKSKLKLLATDVSIKTGKFTPAEDSIIHRNFEDFVKKYNISDPHALIRTGGQKDPVLLRFLKAKHFYVRLGKDLDNRSLNSIYKRARIILNPLKKSEKLTENEVEDLKKLHVVFQNKWQLIGDSLGCTAERCAETYRWHEKDIAKGPFNEGEINQLIVGIKIVSGSSDLSSKKIKGISWDAVATYVPTRNASQCRVYWGNNLAWAPQSERNKWDQDCYRRLIRSLKEQDVENTSSIDWQTVYESFQDFAPSELFLQKKWLYLRSRVDDYAHKSFAEILNELCGKYSMNDYDEH